MITSLLIFRYLIFFIIIRYLIIYILFPYTTLFRSPMDLHFENMDRNGVNYLLGYFFAEEVATSDYVKGAIKKHPGRIIRSEEHTSELQSHCNLVCILLLEKKN